MTFGELRKKIRLRTHLFWANLFSASALWCVRPASPACACTTRAPRSAPADRFLLRQTRRPWQMSEGKKNDEAAAVVNEEKPVAKEDDSKKKDKYDEQASIMCIDGDPEALARALRRLAEERGQHVERVGEGPEGTVYGFKRA